MRSVGLGATVTIDARGAGSVVLEDGHDVTNLVVGIKYERSPNGAQQLWLQFVPARVDISLPETSNEEE